MSRRTSPLAGSVTTGSGVAELSSASVLNVIAFVAPATASVTRLGGRNAAGTVATRKVPSNASVRWKLSCSVRTYRPVLVREIDAMPLPRVRVGAPAAPNVMIAYRVTTPGSSC